MLVFLEQSVFDIVQDYTEMSTTPNDAEELLALLIQRHRLIMDARPEKRPGQFKIKSNKLEIKNL